MNRSVVIATLIAVGVTGWILSGQFDFESEGTPDEASSSETDVAPITKSEKTTTTNEHKLIQVEVLMSTGQQQAQPIVVRGTTEAIRTVEIKAETPGRVFEILVDRGQRVKKGDVLVKFAIKDRKAQLSEAEALVRQRQIEYDAAKSLNKKGFSAKTTLASTQALLDSALAQAESVRIKLEDLIIRAPFDGIIEDRAAELGDFIKDGNLVVTLVDENPVLIIGQISELYVNKIKVGDLGTAKLVTGEAVSGTVRFIGKTADPATRTFRVELLVENTDRVIRSGVTAETTFMAEKVLAHFISPAILTLNDAGVLGVRSVDDQDIVQFHPINVLSDSNKGAWITGLPAQSRLIRVGQEFVKDGEKVLPQKQTAGVQ